MWRPLIILFTFTLLCGCNMNLPKDATLIDYISVQDEKIDLYINKTTEENIIELLGLPIKRIEYLDQDEYWDMGYPECYESGADAVKHIKLTYDGMYRTKNIISDNHIQIINHQRVLAFHNINGQTAIQSYTDEEIELVIHNGKLRSIPNEDGRTSSCLFIVDHRNPKK